VGRGAGTQVRAVAASGVRGSATVATARLYLEPRHGFEAAARVVAVSGGALAFDRTCFYPGGGGQPADDGTVRIGDAEPLEIVSAHADADEIVSAHADADEIVWHVTRSSLAADLVGRPAKLVVNKARRLALTRYHTVLHFLNTIALRDYGGWITGVQISVDQSRIDFKLDALSATLCAELESKVNAVLSRDHAVKAYFVSEEEFRTRDDLLRTLEAKPPVSNGRVRVVEIEGFDAQACGGTHVSTTAEVGRLAIVRTENKGRINKRLYIRLDDGRSRAEGR
jgi:misacylated tRNA(Ala) deacylase